MNEGLARDEDSTVDSATTAGAVFLFDFLAPFFLKTKPSTFCLPGAVALRTMMLRLDGAALLFVISQNSKYEI